MKDSLLSIVLILILISPSSGQLLISGRVFNQSDRKPIVYTNIGIVNTGIGTISNEDGTFSLQVPEQNSNDTLLFSAIGFRKRHFPIQSIAKGEVIVYLKEHTTLLNEVTIVSRKEKNKTFELGNRNFHGGVIETDTMYAGASMALLIENKNPFQKDLSFPVYLEKARLRIFRNNLKSFKIRVRLYDVDTVAGGPEKDITNESIVLESSMKNGWLEFDLTRLKHKVSKPFFIAFEQILNKNDRTLIANGYRELKQKHPNKIKIDTIVIGGRKTIRQTFAGSGLDLPGTFIGIAISETARQQHTSYNRNTSFDKWKKVRGILSATITVSNQLTSSGDEISDVKEKPCQETAEVCTAIQSLKDFLNETGVNGIQLCVSVKGKIKLSQGFGMADVENNLPVTVSTRFRINSISKAITSAALIKLMSENKLDLDAPIQKYVPSFPEKKYLITTRQLAGHLAGIRAYNEKDLSDLVRNEHYKSAAQAIRIFENDSLLFKPGSDFLYSTFGWNLIGAVIEGASGMNYLDYMQENIWKPMNMLGTCGDDKTKNITNRSKFYDVTGEENEYGDFSYKYSGGGLLSTAEDLVRFGNELLHGYYLKPTQTALLFETQFTSNKKPTGYGVGWYISKDKNGHRIWHHAGDIFSSSSNLIIYPDDDIVIAFLANSQDGVLFDIQKIGELFY